MSLHDRYARRTPFELAFGGAERGQSFARAVEEEAAGRGVDLEEPHAFVTLGALASFVRELQGPDTPPEAIHQYGALAFHGVHFARASYPLYLLDTHAARLLVEGAPEGTPRPPARAGYVQLPQHLFWSEATDLERPDSVDGVSWTLNSRGVLQSMLVTGMHPGRAGLRVVPLPEAPLADAEQWLEVDARGDGKDFSTAVPGSEIDALYGLSTAGEVLKLLARFFAYLGSVPSASREESADPEVEGPEPSELRYARVRLVA